MTPVLLLCSAHIAQTQEAGTTLPAVAMRFPGMMRHADVEGTAIITVRIDSLGRPVPGTTRTISAGHELFALAARNGVARWALGPRERRAWLQQDTLRVIADFRFVESGECPPTLVVNFRGELPLPDARESLAWDDRARGVRVRVTSCHATRRVDVVH